ncbi:MAG: hypothetical protein DRR06_07620 [Gammaproteobacteria bacterium]|nr:MAG: hypothetical protein DRR06_07620 [Gammaproteobacteria bacterium]RLA51792.1 MAG: hypothetical protein DRR42_09425 [Gammaproteobacteria bacterium]
MNFRQLFFPALLVLCGLTTNAIALEKIVGDVEEACANEIKTYCSQVTPGNGRLLACFYAHEDKLSGWCGHTLYESAIKLREVVAVLNYVAEECKDDILSNCAEVPMGTGLVMECLKANPDTVDDDCEKALAETSEIVKMTK